MKIYSITLDEFLNDYLTVPISSPCRYCNNNEGALSPYKVTFDKDRCELWYLHKECLEKMKSPNSIKFVMGEGEGYDYVMDS